MELESALAQIGAEIVKTEERDGTLRVWLRIPTKGSPWSQVLLDFMSKPQGWQVDISKSYFVKEGGIRFLWRVIMTGDTAAAQAALVAALDRKQEIREVTSMPLVGRVEYPHDLANGKSKGAYEAKDNIAARAIGGG